MTPRFYVRQQIVMVYDIDPRDDSTGDTGLRTMNLLVRETEIRPHQVDTEIRRMVEVA